MVLVYVVDILCVSHDPATTMKGIQGTFKLKDDKIEKPTMCLGAQVSQKVIEVLPRVDWCAALGSTTR